MKNDAMSWSEFCELYYDTAKKYAGIHLARLRKNNGQFNRRIDLDYVTDAAVLSSLEKAYAHYDSKKGVKITTFLSTLVHNAIVDEIKKESKNAAVQQDIDDLKAAIRSYGYDASAEARENLIVRMKQAIALLSPSDQVILNYYLEDKSSYVEKSSQALNISENYVSVRRNRIMKLLPQLMKMTRSDYLKYCYEYEDMALAGDVMNNMSIILEKDIVKQPRYIPNPILPTIDIDALASRLVAMV